MRPLPSVHPDLSGVEQYYSKLLMRPLHITAFLGTAFIPAEPPDRLHLDGILSWSVVTSRPYPLNFSGPTIVVPLPLQCLWVSPDGHPLWATSMLRPQGSALHDKSFWHKRYPQDRADWDTRGRAITSRGRWKEYRMPVATIMCEQIEAVCVGHQRAIEELLALVTHVGKKGSMGFGQILRWLIEPWPGPTADAIRYILAQRPVPTAYYAVHPPPKTPRNLVQRGWSPPYWYAPQHALCVEPER